MPISAKRSFALMFLAGCGGATPAAVTPSEASTQVVEAAPTPATRSPLACPAPVVAAREPSTGEEEEETPQAELAPCTGAMRPDCNEDDPIACPHESLDLGDITVESGYMYGNGYMGENDWSGAAYTKETCRMEISLSYSTTNDSTLVRDVHVGGAAQRNRQHANDFIARIGATVGVNGPVARWNDPAAALARMVLSRRTRDEVRERNDMRLTGPFNVPQGPLNGEPSALGPVSIWRSDVPRNAHAYPIQADIVFVGGATGAAFYARRSRQVDDDVIDQSSMEPDPVKRTTFGPIRIEEYISFSRYETRFLAIYDEGTNQHRWVTLSHNTHWIGEFDGFLIGEDRYMHPATYELNTLLLIRIADGAAFILSHVDDEREAQDLQTELEQREQAHSDCISTQQRAAYAQRGWTDEQIAEARRCDDAPEAIVSVDYAAEEHCEALSELPPHVAIDGDTLRIRIPPQLNHGTGEIAPERSVSLSRDDLRALVAQRPTITLRPPESADDN